MSIALQCVLTLASIAFLAGASVAQVDGSGTVGRVPLFLDSDTIGNSAIRESNGNVGIGVNPHNALRFLVNGGIGSTRASSTLPAFIANQSGTADIAEFQSGHITLVAIDNDGNVRFTTNKASATIGFPIVNFGGRDLTIRAGGNATSHLDAAGGGNLILRAGNANISSPDIGCPTSGPFGNSVRIVAGDNVFDGVCSTVNNGDIEFYGGDGQPERMRLVGNTGYLGIGTGTPTHPLQMASGAHVTAGGVWTNASSRDLKEDIRELEGADALATLKALRPTRYHYKVDRSDECVGFIAEDVPDLVATHDRKSLSPMDIVGVLTKVVQDQQSQIEELKGHIEALKSPIAAALPEAKPIPVD